MYTGTHAFAPVLIASGLNVVRVARGRPRVFSGRNLFYLAVCGALPDLLSPHFSLADRLSSWTHTAWFAITSLPAIAVSCRWLCRDRWCLMTLGCWLSIVLHILCDAVSGGIVPFHPLDVRIGAYYVHYRLWLTLDAAIIGLTIASIVFVRLRERQLRATSAGPSGG